ncbi:hypothetical protein [Actinomadura rugatobispora]|uniref:Uncharacterized protein n=1 Tax=Actinomadura rugatobispora TaxID=1994 RepID=A0ABW1AES8_9ACTN|nr:hypothetical protein GCM10010200_054450 [Actinomadura rugatobispora]
MDLESELRHAMAEQVAEAAAPPSLVADVRRRHRRRVTRIRVTVGVAAAAVAVAAVAPGYQSFRAETVGSKGEPDNKGGTVATSQPDRAPAPALPEASPSPDESGAATPKKPADRDGDGPERKPSTGGGDGAVRLPSWVTFLPSGLAEDAPCASRAEGKNRVTTCRWAGSGGWAEVKVVRGSGMSGPEDLITAPSMPKPSSVRGIKALTTERPDSGRQIAWLERPGVGVVVAAGGGAARDQLMRIAEGVRP